MCSSVHSNTWTIVEYRRIIVKKLTILKLHVWQLCCSFLRLLTFFSLMPTLMSLLIIQTLCGLQIEKVT